MPALERQNSLSLESKPPRICWQFLANRSNKVLRMTRFSVFSGCFCKFFSYVESRHACSRETGRRGRKQSVGDKIIEMERWRVKETMMHKKISLNRQKASTFVTVRRGPE